MELLCPRATGCEWDVFHRMDRVVLTRWQIAGLQLTVSGTLLVGDPLLAFFDCRRQGLLEHFVVLIVVRMIGPMDSQGTTHIDFLWKTIAVGILVVRKFGLAINTDGLTALLTVAFPVGTGNAQTVCMIS